MSDHDGQSGSGFSEHRQEAYSAIPTEPEAFLRWAATRPREEGKYELTRGVVQHTMINVTKAHAIVVSNVHFELVRQLDRDRYLVTATDFAVRTVDGVRGPDILVAELDDDLKALATDAPIFLVEVLAPSSVGRDFTEKRDEYFALASLRTYLICSQDEPRAWVWARRDDGSWPDRPDELAGREPVIALGGLAIGLAMAAIFRAIPD